ncbi:MAG TPA: NUDIX hydrolase [Vineibacter sp.]|nr:NUDIX hydrolase [Vineibacter sp.]
MSGIFAQQIAALPWRWRGGRLEILLITSRESRRWVIPKGWPMPRLIASNAAKREAYEEAGVDGAIRRAAIGRYTYEKRAKSGSSRACVVTVFALGVAREHRTWPEHRERTRRWCPVDEAADLVDEAELRAIIRAFAAHGPRGR